MKISIITPVFNGFETIEKTIQSVVNQERDSTLEYIIIDGGSNDGTQGIINKYADQIHTFISEKDKGVYDAMNKGIQKATGDVIGIINADDWYHENTFHTVETYFHQNPSLDVLYSSIENYLDGEYFNTFVPGNIQNLYVKFILNHPSCFVKKSVYEHLGGFDLGYKIAADYDFISRAYASGAQFLCADTTLASYSLDGMSGFKAPLKTKVRQLKESYKISKARILETNQASMLRQQQRFYLNSYLKLFLTFPLKKTGVITPRRTNRIKKFIRDKFGRLQSDSYGSW